eukprot:1149529-Pelagomonas_calceolata.AAC.10
MAILVQMSQIGQEAPRLSMKCSHAFAGHHLVQMSQTGQEVLQQRCRQLGADEPNRVGGAAAE